MGLISVSSITGTGTGTGAVASGLRVEVPSSEALLVDPPEVEQVLEFELDFEGESKRLVLGQTVPMCGSNV